MKGLKRKIEGAESRQLFRLSTFSILRHFGEIQRLSFEPILLSHPVRQILSLALTRFLLRVKVRRLPDTEVKSVGRARPTRHFRQSFLTARSVRLTPKIKKLFSLFCPGYAATQIE